MWTFGFDHLLSHPSRSHVGNSPQCRNGHVANRDIWAAESNIWGDVREKL